MVKRVKDNLNVNRREREEMQLTQSEVAGLIGVSQATVVNAEHGGGYQKGMIDFYRMVQIVQAYPATPEIMYTETELRELIELTQRRYANAKKEQAVLALAIPKAEEPFIRRSRRMRTIQALRAYWHEWSERTLDVVKLLRVRPMFPAAQDLDGMRFRLVHFQVEAEECRRRLKEYEEMLERVGG